MNVLFVIGYFRSFTGSQRTAHMIASGLPPEITPHFLVLGEGRAAQELRADGFAVDVAEVGAGFDVFGGELLNRGRLHQLLTTSNAIARAAPAIASVLRRRHIDVVHCNDARALLIAGPVARALHRPVLWHVQGRLPFPERMRSALALLPDAIAVVANALREDVWFGRTPVETIYSAAPQIHVAPIDPWHELLDGADAAVRLVTASSLTPYKGLHHVPPAIAALCDRDPALREQLRWVMLGDDSTPEAQDYRALVLGLAEQHGVRECVVPAGYRNDSTAIIAHATALVVPTVDRETITLPSGSTVDAHCSEGIPVSMYEAFAAGTPVVATRVSGIPELVLEGRNGWLVEPSNPADLARGISSLLALTPDERATIAAEARATAHALSSDRVVREFTRLYLRLINAKRVPRARHGAVPVESPAPWSTG